MKFFQPVKPYVINQKFGENKACVSLDGKNTFITCDGHNPQQGFKSVYGEKGHLGIDLRTAHGQEVYCSQEGVVSFIDTNPKSGLDIRVESKELGDTYTHIYEHLLGYQPKVGDKIKTGQLLGWADNTGWSSGDHLHFEVWKNGVPINPEMENMFAKDYLLINDTLKYLAEQVALISDKIGDFLRKKMLG